MDEIKDTLKEEGTIKTFLNFDRMITPTIIKIIFYISLFMSVFMGLVITLRGGLSSIMGLIVIVVSPLIVRVQCELLIILFKIYELLLEKQN